MLLRVFEEEHEEQVNHCQFTNTTQRLLLVTCSNDKILNTKVWESVFYMQVPLITLHVLSRTLQPRVAVIQLFSVLLYLSYFILISVCCMPLCFCSCGTSTSHPPRTPCLAILSQSTTVVSPLMTAMCPLPLTMVQSRCLLLSYLTELFSKETFSKLFYICPVL